MLVSIEPKMMPWNGFIAAQYASPGKPRGWKYALCV
jgi:hypothetical protein